MKSSSRFRVWLRDFIIYEGEVNTNYEPHGVGKRIFPNGSICEGRFEKGFEYGQCRLLNPDGSYELLEFDKSTWEKKKISNYPMAEFIQE